MTHSAVLLVLDALAAFRLTRLVVADSITARIRQRLAGRAVVASSRAAVVARPRLAEFVSCPWCVSPYLAGAVVVCQALAAGVWLYVSAVLAFSAVAGLLSEH